MMKDPGKKKEPFFTWAAHTDEDADFTPGVFEDALKEVSS